MIEPLTAPMYVTVGPSDKPPKGYTWRIWSSRTSFYLKSRAPGMEHLKLSVHGDDPRHPRGGGFKLAMDTEETFERAVAEGRIRAARSGQWPLWFPGKRINDDAILVARLRWTWDGCTRLPPAPSPGELKDGAVGLAVAPPPEPGDAVDVDLIVSTKAPYWYREQQARVDKACLGPLRNDAGQWLAGTAVKRLASTYPPPPPISEEPPLPSGRGDEARGLRSAVDPEGFVWIIERRVSADWLASLQQ